MKNRKKDYSRYFRPISENEMKDWRPAPKSFTTKLFEAFLESKHQMVEVKLDELPEPRHKETSKVKSTKQDSFASAFYAWKRKGRTQRLLKRLGIDVLLIRRGEKVALKKKQRGK
jgi:hypothetical protein